LLTYADVKKHAKDIVDVTNRRYMPPWPPDPKYNQFIGQRILEPSEIQLLADWLAEGAPEGNPAELPREPKWPEGWSMGKPDLVVTMPRPYTLPAEGRDIYRNFVIPLDLDARRYVKAVDFQLSNKAVHHVFMLFDRTKQSRRLDEETQEPGFPGMGQPGNAESPSGQFLSWRPGKKASKENTGSSWLLQKGADLVLQMHMQTTGKPEQIQPSVAFYFTDVPPNELVYKVGLDSIAIDIPPGESNYVVRDSYRLPVDSEVLAILPHAHYVAKELRSFATLPDGSRKWLLMIKDWDFKWQSDYYYAQPITLPKGSTVEMEFIYDNSANNPRNPNDPPARVQYGLQTSDEMANLALLFRFRNKNDLNKFISDYQFKGLRGIITFNEYALRKDPNDAHAHTQLAKALIGFGKTVEAEQHLRMAIKFKPNSDDAHYHLGLLFDDAQKPAAAKKEYELAIQFNPEHIEARNNLGLLLMNEGNFAGAEQNFRAALQIAPEEKDIEDNLKLLEKTKRSARQRQAK
jgi:tetratricopeptide (TPR) repeat protein